MPLSIPDVPRPLLLLTLLSAFLRSIPFVRTEHPLGTDGYYYVVQGASWAHQGLHVPDSSWMLRLLGVVALVLDPIVATKVVAVGLATLCVPAAYKLGERLGGSAGWWLAGWAAASPTLTHLAADFPKNLAIAAPWLLMCAFVMERRWLAAGVAGLLLALAHKLGAVLLLASLAGFALAALSPRALVGLAGGGVVLAGLAALPGTLSPAESWRLAGQLAPGAGWPPFCWLHAVRGPEQGELVLALIGALLGVVRLVMSLRWKRATPADRAGGDNAGLLHSGPVATASIAGLCLPLLLLALAPIWATDTLDLGYRLALLTPLLAAPLWASVLSTRSERTVAQGLAFVWLCFAPFAPDTAPPYDRYEQVIDVLPRPLPELLVAHQGMSFLYDHQTGREALAWAPDPWLDPERVGRLAWGIREAEWVSSGVERVRLTHEYSYLTEDQWRTFVRHYAEDDDLRDRIEDWRNPSRVRPAALVRGRAKVPQEGR